MPLELQECIKDSPRFRAALDGMERDVLELEEKLEKVVKLCAGMIESGKAYNASNKRLLDGLQELSQSTKNEGVTNILEQCVEGLQEMILYHTMLFDQAERSVKIQLQNIITQDIGRLRDLKKDFDRIGDDLESAQVKNGQVSRHRTHDAQETSHILLATHKCFRHLALDYILQMNAFETQQKYKIINTLLSYLNAENTFFHQGYDLLKDLDPLMKHMSTQLDQIANESLAQQKELEKQHMSAQQQDISADYGTEYLRKAPQGIAIEGYLFKRAPKASKTWNRHWFSIQNNQLVHQTKLKEDPVPVVEDLRLCSVKPLDEIERRFCFEVVSVRTSCVLQADSESLRQAWIQAVGSSIDTAYREAPDSDTAAESSEMNAASSLGKEGPREGPSVLQQVVRLPGNERCCDCGRADPRWASINLGITLCIECSGIHRSLGVHLSKVRSLTLDSWEPELLKLICALGNNVVNSIYEAEWQDAGVSKVTAESPRREKEQWIKAKYVMKRFLKKLPSPESSGTEAHACPTDRLPTAPSPPDLLLYRAATVGEVPGMCEALAFGAGVNRPNAQDGSRTPLIAAARGGSLSACEFLLQNGANVNYRDARGQAAIHVATHVGHTGPVCLLLKRGANQYAADEMGQDPLSIAIATANADIVTLLRLARMNEEMRESEGFFGHTGEDETFQDIFRDFSRMASDDPEKLARRRFDGSEN
uniref:arf-GAP with coiled-coil, ANK repeat and PH domain-containing protein 2-like n=1 Tax=Pristiophorus japonicus TaxID=55135 RepID=UPI00398F3F05